MSGGVDSSVAAILLKENGYEVIGATMKLWEDKKCQEVEGGCCSFRATIDAKRVCDKLEIPHYTLNNEKEFQKYVIEDFVHCYQCSKTPNPCVECNKYLKFGVFYEKAKEWGCDYIATGHYASIEFSNSYQQYVLKKSKEEKKDQTYFLYTIAKEKLQHILFPLQDCKSKEEIRKIADENDLLVAQKKESQEICFVPDNDYQSFLKKYGRQVYPKGDIIQKDREVLGQHQGFINYTIGQRKGIGISYQEPLYVLALDKEKNEVVVGTQKELYKKELYAKEINWLVFDELKEPIQCKAKIRYRAKEANCIVYPDKDILKVVFEDAQRAITPGQSIVFYDEEGVVLGGGKIF